MDDTKDSMYDFEYKPPQPECPNKIINLLQLPFPLFMPPGSVRALMAMAVVGAFIAVCVVTENIEALAVIATMVAKDYFESRKV